MHLAAPGSGGWHKRPGPLRALVDKLSHAGAAVMAPLRESGAKPRDLSVKAVMSCAWPALLLAAACLLPFLNKPFHTDDPGFLRMARQIVEHPAHPLDF